MFRYLRKLTWLFCRCTVRKCTLPKFSSNYCNTLLIAISPHVINAWSSSWLFVLRNCCMLHTYYVFYFVRPRWNRFRNLVYESDWLREIFLIPKLSEGYIFSVGLIPKDSCKCTKFKHKQYQKNPSLVRAIFFLCV
jgi:hypothetical protein